MRWLFFIAAVSFCSAKAMAERIVDGPVAIYRELTDDYLLGVRFVYEPDFSGTPDSHFAFFIYGTRQDGIRDTLGAVGTWDFASTGEASMYRLLPQPQVFVDSFPVTVDGRFASVTIPRSVISSLGDVDVLFPFHVQAAALDGSGEYQFGIPNPPLVNLNVPEPSSVLLAATTIVPLSIFVRRRLRSIRAAT